VIFNRAPAMLAPSVENVLRNIHHAPAIPGDGQIQRTAEEKWLFADLPAALV
jgi:hypothetical protein